MKRAPALAAALLALVGAAGEAAQPEAAAPARVAQPLGRLFFTPPERAQLDTARSQKRVLQAAPEQPAAAPPQIVTYGGIVRRSDGKALLWLNNQLVEEKEAISSLNMRGRVRPDGTVTIQVPDSTSSIDVRVGQSLEIHSGKVAESRRPAPEQAPPAPVAKPTAPEAKSPAPKPGEREAPEARAELPDAQRVTGAK